MFQSLSKLVTASATFHPVTLSKNPNPLLADKKTLTDIIKAGPKGNRDVYDSAMDRIFSKENEAFCEEFFNDPDVQRRSIKSIVDSKKSGAEKIDRRIREALNSQTCQACLPPDQRRQILARIKKIPGVTIDSLELRKFFAHEKVEIKQRAVEFQWDFIKRWALVKAKQPELLSDYLSRRRNAESQSLTEAEIYLNPDIVQIAGDGWCYLNAVFSGIILDCVDSPEKLRDFANNLEDLACEISISDGVGQVVQALRSIADQGLFSREQALRLISDELGVILVLSTEIGEHIVETAHRATVQHFCDEFAPILGVSTEHARNLINELERQDINNDVDRFTFLSHDVQKIERNLERAGITIADQEQRENLASAVRPIETHITAVKRKTNPDVLYQSITNSFDDMVAIMGYRAILMDRETNNTVERLQSSIDSAKKRQEKPLYLRLEGAHYNLLCPNKIVVEQATAVVKAPEAPQPLVSSTDDSDDDLGGIQLACVVS